MAEDTTTVPERNVEWYGALMMMRPEDANVQHEGYVWMQKALPALYAPGVYLLMCVKCGAVTESPLLHTKWHATLEGA